MDREALLKYLAEMLEEMDERLLRLMYQFALHLLK